MTIEKKFDKVGKILFFIGVALLVISLMLEITLLYAGIYLALVYGISIIILLVKGKYFSDIIFRTSTLALGIFGGLILILTGCMSLV